MYKTFSKSSLLLLLASMLYAQPSLELKTEETVLSVGGRINFLTRFSNHSTNNITKNIASSDPDEKYHFNYEVKYSRLWFKTKTPSEYGMIRTLVEIDFAGTAKGTQVATNSSGPRLRHAYAQIGNWTVGQTNSAFNSLVNLDIIEYPINFILVRQALIRYTVADKELYYDFSVEQPETTLVAHDGKYLLPEADLIPDMVFRTRYYPKWGQIGVSVMGRYLHQDQINEDGVLGWGVNFSSKFNIGADDIRMGAYYGDGLGRYISFGSFTAGTLDVEGEIEGTPTYGGHFGYRHWWSEKLRSTAAMLYTKTKYDTNRFAVGADLDKIAQGAYSFEGNLLWSPVVNSLIGCEYTYTKIHTLSSRVEERNAFNLLFRYDF